MKTVIFLTEKLNSLLDCVVSKLHHNDTAVIIAFVCCMSVFRRVSMLLKVVSQASGEMFSEDGS